MSLGVCENYSILFLMVCFSVDILDAKSKLVTVCLDGQADGF